MMACPANPEDGFRQYRRPSIRAKFQTHRKKSEEDLKEALKSAKEQQQHVSHVLRSESSWHSGVSRCEEGYPLHKAHAILRRQSKRLRNSWLSTSTPPTLVDQNAASAAPSSLDLGLPDGCYAADPHSWSMEETQQPQPTAKLERQPAKREVKRLQKDRKKEEKEAKKALKAAERHNRRELHRRVTEDRARKNTTIDVKSHFEARPEIDGDGSYFIKPTSTHAWKLPLLKLSTHSRRSKQIIPMPGDFSSKSDLHAYLNPVDEMIDQTPAIPQIPELPAGPPPYNPLESSGLPDPNNAISTSIDAANGQVPPIPDTAQPIDREGSSKPMLCDVCYSGIGLSDVYYHCDKCDGGDRILCSGCTEAGRRCRHPGLVARVSSVTKAPEVLNVVRNTSATPPNRQLSIRTSPAGRSLSVLDRKLVGPLSPSGDQFNMAANADMQTSEAFERAVSMLRDMKVHDDFEKSIQNGEQSYLQPKQLYSPMEHEQNRRREIRLASRERAIAQREQEAAIRERESALREHQASLREREASLRERELAFVKLEPAMSSEREDAALSAKPTLELPLQKSFVDNKEYTMEVVRAMVADILSGSVPRIYLSPGDAQVRAHAAGSKRKACTESNHSRSSLTASGTVSNLNANGGSGARAPLHLEKDDEPSDEEESTPPKRPKHNPQSTSQHLQRLLACPYAKCDPVRYSERNAMEKQYRGCSGRYLTDISRLKQHLYRVHQRPEHACARCDEVFKSREVLDGHLRSMACEVVERRRFAERFDDDQMRELKRKRPGKSVEESWYIIFRILFPNIQVPESPYVDDVAPSSTANNNIATDVDSQTTSNLLEIFNEQLSQQQNADNLVSDEVRELINKTLKQSMTELLRRIGNTPSNTNTPSMSMGRTPSILVSPTSAQPRSTLHTPMSSVPASPVGKRRGPSVPWLSPLQTDISERRIFAVPEIVERSPSTQKQSQVEEMRGAIKSESWESYPATAIDHNVRSVSPDLSLPDIENFGAYLGQDDNIRLAISEFDFGFQGTAVEEKSAESNTNFVPVKLSTLTDDPDPTATTTTSLKMTSSKRSLDSGYGSMHSRDRERINHPPQQQQQQQEQQPQKQVEVERVGETDDVDLAFLDHDLYETLRTYQSGYWYEDTLDLDLEFERQRRETLEHVGNGF